MGRRFMTDKKLTAINRKLGAITKSAFKAENKLARDNWRSCLTHAAGSNFLRLCLDDSHTDFRSHYQGDDKSEYELVLDMLSRNPALVTAALLQLAVEKEIYYRQRNYLYDELEKLEKKLEEPAR